MSRLTVRNIGQLHTVGGREPIAGGEVEIADGMVAYAGPSRSGEAPRPAGQNPYPKPPLVSTDSEGNIDIDVHGALVTPGLIDPHTHLVYGGDRAFELPLKLAGVPYLEILKRGGGILSTVRSTRAASDEELYEAASVRLRSMIRQGVTTVEIKSGYGLDLQAELRLLDVIAELRRTMPITIITTFMGAHAVPEEFRGRTDEYVREVELMLPAVARRSDVTFCDVFCEAGVFSLEQSRRILQAAEALGLKVKMHVDELSVGDGEMSGAELAAELGATSADHLRVTGDRGFAAMQQSGVVPVVLPATSFCLRDGVYADARAMIDGYGLPVALATDCNPGTSPTESLQLVMAIAALYLRMTAPEILAGVTVHAAKAIGVEETRGTLQTARAGDLVIWEAYDLDILPYRFGSNQAPVVVRDGVVVAV